MQVLVAPFGSAADARSSAYKKLDQKATNTNVRTTAFCTMESVAESLDQPCSEDTASAFRCSKPLCIVALVYQRTRDFVFADQT